MKLDRIGITPSALAAGWATVAPVRPAIAYRGRPIQCFVSPERLMPARLMPERIETPDPAQAYVLPAQSSRIS